jgi:hypothetical protein
MHTVLKSHIKTIFIFIVLLTALMSCYHYPEEEDFGYDEYNRVIGPEGGEIYFYRNYEDDSERELIVKMDFPVNAVDSVLVFNMYEFWDEVTYYDLNYILSVEAFSDFLYFVPFYESDGYREVLTDTSDFESLVQKHVSIQFNTPVTVTYYNSFYEYMTDTAVLYRINIPGENEWGIENNVWVNYNIQGYPDGYDAIDLIYLIMGRWTETTEWGSDVFSLDNWEVADTYTLNVNEESVSFEILDTDYMYVMGTVYPQK